MLDKRTRPPIIQIDKTFEFAGQNHQNVSALFFLEQKEIVKTGL